MKNVKSTQGQYRHRTSFGKRQEYIISGSGRVACVRMFANRNDSKVRPTV